MKEEDFVIKVKAIENFGFSKMNEITNLKRYRKNLPNEIVRGDTFECDKKMFEYLNGNNPYNKSVVKIIEYKPDEK